MNQCDYTLVTPNLYCCAQFFVKSKLNWSSAKQCYSGEQITGEVILHKKNRKIRLNVHKCSLKLCQLKHTRKENTFFKKKG